MIVPSMTPEEVYREIERDMPNVAAWWMRQRKAVAKRARSMNRFPQTFWYEYTSHRHNRYMVMSVLTGQSYEKNNSTGVYALLKMERGYALYYTRFPWQHAAGCVAIMPHAFDRYAERFGVPLSGVELIKEWITRNAYGVPADDERFVGRSVRYNGRDNACSCLQDGVLLGEFIGGIFVGRTFITYSMATGLQRKEFEQNRQKVLSPEEARRAVNLLLREWEQAEREELLSRRSLIP